MTTNCLRAAIHLRVSRDDQTVPLSGHLTD